MELSQRFRIWLARRGALVLFFVVVVILSIVSLLREKPQPRITRTLGSSTQHVNVLWFRQDISPYITVGDGVAYAIQLTWDDLISFDIKTGSTNWAVKLPFERSGVRGLLANTNTVFTINATRVDAYEATTGELKWSTELGNGHVPVILQLDSALVRVYYGDKLFEIDPETGKILTTTPKDTIVWASGNVVLKTLSNNQLAAFDKQTGELLWDKCDMCDLFYAREDKIPQNMDTDTLIVGYKDKRICALELLTGKDKWCRPEAYISKVAVDYQSQLGYAMRDDMVLVTIDLQTGNILGETSFGSLGIAVVLATYGGVFCHFC